MLVPTISFRDQPIQCHLCLENRIFVFPGEMADPGQTQIVGMRFMYNRPVFRPFQFQKHAESFLDILVFVAVTKQPFVVAAHVVKFSF